MPAIPEFSPIQFRLTNPYSGQLLLNTEQANGFYGLDQANCEFINAVRSTSNDVPQSDGAILHHRFLSGVQIPLAIQLWESPERNAPACKSRLRKMLDELSGSLISLLNAGDNQGRLIWDVYGVDDETLGPPRMIDDARLLVYPSYRMIEGVGVVTATLDTRFPYAQNETQQRTGIADGGTSVLVNDGSIEYFSVIQINKLNGVLSGDTVTDFTITVVNAFGTTEFNWTSSLPGSQTIGPTHYAEWLSFENTLFLDGSGANLSPGIVQLESDYWALAPGNNSVSITGADMDVLWAPAFG